MQIEQGITMEARMHSRAHLRGIQKWRSRKLEFAEELERMRLKLQRAMGDADKLPKHKMWHLRSCLSGWPAKAGLGVDLWVLKAWANLQPCVAQATPHAVPHGRGAHADASAHGPHRPPSQTQGGRGLSR